MDCVDLFSGCGGMSLGFQNAGFNIKAAFDNWQAAVDIYSANFDHPAFKYDLYDAEAVPKIEEYSPSMIIGGPLARTSPLRAPDSAAKGPISPSDMLR